VAQSIVSVENGGFAQVQERVRRRRGIRVLVDGPDLSGKSTLVRLLQTELEKIDWKVVCRKGRRNPTRLFRLLTRIDANKHPDSGLLNAAYIFETLFDLFRDTEVPDNTILITEGYVDRSIAYGLARRLGWPARLGLRLARLFPSFDLAVLVFANLATRSARLIERSGPSEIDRCSIDSHYRFLAGYRMIFRRHQQRLLLNTTTLSQEAALASVVERVMYVANLKMAERECKGRPEDEGWALAFFTQKLAIGFGRTRRGLRAIVTARARPKVSE
jgi:thymidylate kinase